MRHRRLGLLATELPGHGHVLPFCPCNGGLTTTSTRDRHSCRRRQQCSPLMSGFLCACPAFRSPNTASLYIARAVRIRPLCPCPTSHGGATPDHTCGPCCRSRAVRAPSHQPP
eukprot:05692_4